MTVLTEDSAVRFALMSDGSVMIHQRYADGSCSSVNVGSVDGLTPLIDGLSAFQKRCRDAGYGKRSVDA